MPHRDLWISSVGQIDFHDDAQLITQAADAIAEFFGAVLNPDE